MSKTPSSMLPLGTLAPQFSLINVINGQNLRLESTTSAHATVIFFICNHCPYVKHINKELTKLAKNYLNKNIDFIAINSNDVENYPDDSPDNMKKTALEENYPFPYLYDETQEVAKAYQAACTPDFYIFDNNLKLVYRGQFDDSRPGNNIAVTGNSIQAALENVLNHEPISLVQKPSLGCNIKWKN